MKNKIVQLMKSEGLTSSRLAEVLEIQPSGISHLVSGRNKPSFELLKKILRCFPNINPYWLLLDDERMYCEAEPLVLSGDVIESSDSVVEATHVDRDLFTLPSKSAHHSTEQMPSDLLSAINQVKVEESSNIELSKAQLTQVILLYSDGSCSSFCVK